MALYSLRTIPISRAHLFKCRQEDNAHCMIEHPAAEIYVSDRARGATAERHITQPISRLNS